MHAREAIIVTALADLPVEAWRNGGGVTRTLCQGDDWRASLADIARDGPYSRFAGTTRLSVIVGGHGVQLVDAEHGRDAAQQSGGTIRLLPGRAVQFDGGLAWQATLLDGPSQALNLIARADRHRVRAATLDVEVPLGVPRGAGLVVLSGARSCALRDLASDRSWRLAPHSVWHVARLDTALQLCGGDVAEPVAERDAPPALPPSKPSQAPMSWPIAAIVEALA